MPLATTYLLSLRNTSTSLPALLAALPAKPIIHSRVIRWIVLPSTTPLKDPLLTHPWDLLLIFPARTALSPAFLAAHAVTASYALTIGIPTPILTSLPAKNARYLHPAPADVPPLTGTLRAPRIAASAQTLALTHELLAWARSWDAASEGRGGRGAVSMLNLLAFADGRHGEYVKYGQAFAAGAGARRGGDAKVVGRVVVPALPGGGDGEGGGGGDGEAAGIAGVEVGEGGKGWDEVALAHYPSVWHFADMLASEDYQAANERWRVGSLKDTCILMTSEVVLEEELARGEGGRIKGKM
ncbi:hypothetical protein FH972_021455 [Carpinus fangiana]|uniref:Uncharacterized protein n=1 Tax=Carpinus fangiana TaxID=176857 RepID=A0A5N6KPF5_9ROSI|nr:hypothetical protein FH972_021455 [Carpinus fangiana]